MTTMAKSERTPPRCELEQLRERAEFWEQEARRRTQQLTAARLRAYHLSDKLNQHPEHNPGATFLGGVVSGCLVALLVAWLLWG